MHLFMNCDLCVFRILKFKTSTSFCQHAGGCTNLSISQIVASATAAIAATIARTTTAAMQIAEPAHTHRCLTGQFMRGGRNYYAADFGESGKNFIEIGKRPRVRKLYLG
jgi:hypothetical protein